MKKFTGVIALFIFLFTNSYAQNRFISDSLDIYMENALKLWNIPGASVAVVKDGKIILAKGFGVKVMNSNDGIDENTLFMVASNTKAFTGTALSLLEYDKQISLDDRVLKWMPDFKMYDDRVTELVTIRDLLCHRLGLQTFQGDFINWSSNLSRKEIIDNFRNLKPVFDFRSRYGYCNAGFLTAGEIIPVVTGMTWDDFVTQKILIPLDMKRSSVDGNIMRSDKNTCKGHSIFLDTLKVVPYDAVNNLGPAASLCTSAKDIANWLIMLSDSGRYNGNKVMPYSVLAKTINPNITLGINQSPVFKGIKHIRTYGLGWQVEDYSGRLMVSHTGGVNGFVTSTCFLPEEKIGIAVFTNTDANYLYEALKYQIIDSYLNLPYRNYSNLFYGMFEPGNKEEVVNYKEKMAVVMQNQKPELSLDNYTGTFTNKAYGKINIRLTDDGLKIDFSRHPFLTGNLHYTSGNSFYCIYSHPGWGAKMIDFKVSEGKVKSVTIKVNDNIDFMEYEFEKTD
ncbi:MAG: serine hydrolase [Ignavibacteriae bacterium]|nr:serine hydrolase [Ignavibacteriota bacterium]